MLSLLRLGKAALVLEFCRVGGSGKVIVTLLLFFDLSRSGVLRIDLFTDLLTAVYSGFAV